MVANVKKAFDRFVSRIASPSRIDRLRGPIGPVMETLEARQLLSATLLNLQPGTPLMGFNGSGEMNYTAGNLALVVDADPIDFLLNDEIPAEFAAFVDNGQFTVNLQVANNGNLIGGVAGDDLVITGNIDWDYDTVYDFTGTLLTGEITQMGYQDNGVGTTDEFEFRFTVTGGVLASLFEGKDLGMVLTAEPINGQPSFEGFGSDFTTVAKGFVGSIPKVIIGPTLTDISGTKFRDLTGNGLTADDTGLTDLAVEMQLFADTNGNAALDAEDTYLASTFTSIVDGTYSFVGLEAGKYLVKEIVSAGFLRTAPTLNDYIAVDTTAGNDVTGINFANFEKADCKCAISDVYYVINGSTIVTNLRGNTNQGDTVEVVFTINEGYEPQQLTLVSYTAPSKSFVASEAYLQQIFDIDTGYFGPGTHTMIVSNPDSNFQVDFVCGEAITTFGPAGSNIFYTPQGRLISADNDGTQATLLNDNSASLSGYVFEDLNNNGIKEAGEAGISGVSLRVFTTDAAGAAFETIITTNDQGFYSLTGLRQGVYNIVETQPAGYIDGQEQLGSSGGLIGSDAFAGIVLRNGENATNYNFGEIAEPTAVGGTEGNTPGFWKQKQHFCYWNCYNTSDRFDTVFGVNAPGNSSLLDALKLGGGGYKALMRHAVAALLNSTSGMDYAYTTQQVISMVQQAFASGNYEATKNLFQIENEKGSDLKD
jgi:hypothetical protein